MNTVSVAQESAPLESIQEDAIDLEKQQDTRSSVTTMKEPQYVAQATINLSATDKPKRWHPRTNAASPLPPLKMPDLVVHQMKGPESERRRRSDGALLGGVGGRNEQQCHISVTFDDGGQKRNPVGRSRSFFNNPVRRTPSLYKHT